MADMKQVYDFAVKWLDKFRDQKINYIELIDHYMADDCDALGYKMDCGNAFSERYGEAINNYEELNKIVDDVNDIDLLGSAIYSQWRYFNHWAYTGEEILEFKNRSWFILALSQLAMLAGETASKLDKINSMQSGYVEKKGLMVNAMASIYLNDILNRNGIDPRRTKLIRHSLKHKRCRCCFDNNFIDEYQKIQSKSFFKDCDYILSFISEPGTSAKFIGCYKVGLGNPIETNFMSKGFPVPEMFLEDLYFFNLESIEIMADLKERLIIDWGKATVSWHQWATNEKAVLAIQANPKYAFLGYDKIVLSYTELKEIVKDNILYENWHIALSSVYAIYLIVDKTDGKQYVGSAYGDGGILGRWKFYIDSKHGGNKQFKEMICNCPERYENFQFSILQILPKTITQDEVIRTESLYKQKFLTKEFGLNDN